MNNFCGRTRREFLWEVGAGFTGLALTGLLSRDGFFASAQTTQPGANPLAPRPPHFTPKAKSVIFLFMDGGPSQMDTFDPKPRLQTDNGKPIPFKTPTTVFNISDKILASPYQFRQYGQSGAWVSEIFPNLAGCV